MLYNTPFIAQNSRFDVIQKELTKQQRDLLQNEKEVMKANRKAFKASLTKGQMTILRDKTISKIEIRKRLAATFSTIQKNMVKIRYKAGNLNTSTNGIILAKTFSKIKSGPKAIHKKNKPKAN